MWHWTQNGVICVAWPPIQTAITCPNRACYHAYTKWFLVFHKGWNHVARVWSDASLMSRPDGNNERTPSISPILAMEHCFVHSFVGQKYLENETTKECRSNVVLVRALPPFKENLNGNRGVFLWEISSSISHLSEWSNHSSQNWGYSDPSIEVKICPNRILS